MLLLVPLMAVAARRTRRWRWLFLGFVTLAILGLGGTTGAPRLVFGKWWQLLTYDRFALWAGMFLLSWAGALLLRAGRARSASLQWVGGGFFASLVLCSIVAAGLAKVLNWQPKEVRIAEIVRFLGQPDHVRYRFLTLGFGDQCFKLSVLVDNGTIDGGYPTARSLEELRRSGLGSLDGAVWNPARAAAIAPYLRSDRYGLRWALVNHAACPGPRVGRMASPGTAGGRSALGTARCPNGAHGVLGRVER